MEIVKKRCVLGLILLFPVWGILLPLLYISSGIIYRDPPIPTFFGFIIGWNFTFFDLLAISLGYLFILIALSFASKSIVKFKVFIYISLSIYLIYSTILFSVEMQSSFRIQWQFGLAILLAQCAIFILSKYLISLSRKLLNNKPLKNDAASGAS